jgi:hypothetical protein
LFALVASNSPSSAVSFSSSQLISSSKTSNPLGIARGGNLAQQPALSSTSRLLATSITESVETVSTINTDMTPAAKLDALRTKMRELNLDVYLIPSDDPHLSGELIFLHQFSTQ